MEATTLEQYNTLVEEATKRIPSSYTLRNKEAFAIVCGELRKRLNTLVHFRIQAIYPILVEYSKEEPLEPYLQISLEKTQGRPGMINNKELEELENFVLGERKDEDERTRPFYFLTPLNVFLSLANYVSTNL